MALTQGGKDAERGKFSLNFNYIPCPMHYYSIDGYATAKLQSRRFNPKMSSKPYPYYIQRFYTVSCYPDVPFIVPFMGPYPTSMGNPSISPGRLDFPVDTMVLSGAAVIFDENSDMVPVKESTRYVTTDIAPNTNVTNPLHAQSSANLGPIASDYYDFDNDGQPDTSLVGYWETKPDPDTGKSVTKFKTDKLDTVAKSELLQIVYLSSSGKNPAEDPPDFTRATDWQANLNHEGMLRSISPQDFTNTDLYVFRLSDGKLISERLGLAKDDWQWNDEMGADEQTSTFFYHTYLRGYYGDLFRKINGTFVNELNYGDWQAKSGINPALHQRAADHLKPGDKVELIAINRATGYLGSVQTTMQAAGSAGTFGSDMASYIDPIVLRPPNLKIWVDRKFDIKEGLRKGTIVEDQIIGYEGAALSSDQIIAVHTEWLKPDGSAFPIQDDSDATDMGYTGRIAFLTSDQQIASTGQVGIEHFPIKPGKHLQVVQLPGGTQANQQFYIQVSGEPSTGHPIFTTTSSSGKSANFDSTGVHTGKLKNRPNIFVPFLVPVYDEAQTELQRQVHKKLVEDNPGQTYNKPEPTYRWVYRPEFQYSLYDLTLKEINRYQDAADPATKENILNATQPTIASSDDLIEILYNLDITKYTALDYFNSGEEKELIFAIGEQEVKAKVNKQDKLEFTNLEHLANLDPEDFLTIRLYTNNDVGNVLWEYAFGISAIPLIDTVDVSLDDEKMDFSVFFPKLEDGEMLKLAWSTSGSTTASVTTTTTQSESAIHDNVLNLGVEANADLIINVEVLLSTSEYYQQGTKWSFGPYTTMPGEPVQMQTTVANPSLPADTVSSSNVTAIIKDQFGNLVGPNTPVVWALNDSATLVDIQNETNDVGVVSAKYIADEQAGSATIEVMAGNATDEASITKTPLTIELSADKTSIQSGSDDFIQLTVAFTGSEALNGQPVKWTSTAGSLSAYSSTISGGQATIKLYAPLEAGSATVGVSIPGYSDNFFVDFTLPDSPVAALDLPAIVNAPFDGSVMVDTLKGQTSHDYVTSTDLVVHGEPGRTMTIQPGSIYAPNGRQLYGFPLTDLLLPDDVHTTAYVQDSRGEIDATVWGDVELIYPEPDGSRSQSYLGVGRTMAFDSGYLWARNVSSLHVPDDLYLNVRFKPSQRSDGQTIIHKVSGEDTAYKLSLVTDLLGDMYLEATIGSSVETYTLRTEVPLLTDEWYVAGFQFSNGKLILALDDERYSLPVAGQLIDNNDDFYIGGNGFSGFIEDIRIGSVSAAHSLIALAESFVTIGGDGTARVKVQALGNQATVGQKIGFTVTADSGLGSNEAYELKLYTPLPEVARRQEEVSPGFSKLLSILGISSAQAQTGYCRSIQCRKSRESGVMLTNEGIWGSVKEVVMKKLLNDEVIDAVKKTSQFVFELTSINDVWIILKSIYQLGTGQLDQIEGFELTFAVIGVGVTVFAVATSGGAALVPLKASLKSFKTLLKAFWDDIGGAMISKGLVSTTKYMWLNIKLLIDGQTTLAKTQMVDFALAMGKVIRNAGTLIGPFFRNVRSVDDLVHFIRLAKKDSCLLAPPGLGLTPVTSGGEFVVNFNFSLIPKAYAANDCFSRLNAIVQIASRTERFGVKAKDVEQAVFAITKHDKLENLTVDEFEGIAEVAYHHLLRRPEDGFVSRFDAGVKFFDEEKLKKGLRAIANLSKNDALRQSDTSGYKGFVSKFATLQKHHTDPIGTIHTARTLEKIGFDNVKALERDMLAAFPDIEPIKIINGDKVGELHSRRADAWVKVNTNIEMKGSSLEMGKPFRLAGNAELEFLNDAIYYARANQKFEWHIADQLDVGPAKEKMLKMLGDGDIPDKLDGRLKAYIEELDPSAQQSMIDKLEDLYDEVQIGNIIKNAEYLD